MYREIERIFNKAIDRVMEESVCDFSNWWKDDFETDIYFETEEDLKSLSPNDLDIAQADWVYWVIDGFIYSICEELGISTKYNNTDSHDKLLECIWEITRDRLMEAIAR